MYKTSERNKTSLKVNNSYVGQTIEQRIQKIVNNKEPITDSSPMIYTERKDGVLPEYNIRTDRWDLAVDAMDIVTKGILAQREGNKPPEEEIGKKAKEGMEKEEGNVKDESAQTTE